MVIKLKYGTYETLKKKRLFLTLIFISILGTGFRDVEATGKTSFNQISFQLDNDTFFYTDRQYTNGVRFQWTSGRLLHYSDHVFLPDFVDKWVPAIPNGSMDHDVKWMSYYLGQNIYTPDNLRAENVIEDDRPYAGILYQGINLYRIRGKVRYIYTMITGLVGPKALGGEAMEDMHSHFHWQVPRGWDNQLKNEPILNLGFQIKRKLQWPDEAVHWGTAALPAISVAVGNGYTGLSSGVEFLFGTLADTEFGSTQLNSNLSVFNPHSHTSLADLLGVTCSVALNGNWIIHDVTLDGNTFQPSHHVRKEPLTVQLSMGIGVKLKYIKLNFSHVWQTRQFKTQSHPHQYGVLSMTLLKCP